MKTLHELAKKLQEYIIDSQQDAHNSTNMNVNKYNNLKLKMSSKYHYAHIIVIIGISEAIFNITDGSKTQGGLGPDEKYVRKWLGTSNIASNLKEIYIAMSALIKAEDENKSIAMEGESDEAKAVASKKKATYRQPLKMAMPTLDSEISSEDEPKEELITVEEATQHRVAETEQNYIKSIFKQK